MRYSSLLLTCVLVANVAFAADDSWQPLFNGKDLDGWETFLGKPNRAWNAPGLKRDKQGNYLEAVGKNRDPLKVFTVDTMDGLPAIHVSGQGFGVISTTRTFTNFHLRLQVRWGESRWPPRENEPRDCGLLYFIHGEPGYLDGAWPRCVEFQIQQNDFGDLWVVGTRTTVPARREQAPGKPTRYIYDPNGAPTPFVEKPPFDCHCIRLVDAEKPHGEWNTLDLVCLNGDCIHVVNGEVVMRSHNAERLDGAGPLPLRFGAIGLQSEGAEVFFRDVEIREIRAIPAKFSEH